MNTKLGRMERVGLRNIWKSESGQFTPWLAEEDNIALLGEALGIELEVQSIERDVGPFRADILCKDAQSDRQVIIENQIEETDHSHLGQLLTYAAGLDASIIVWIAETFTEEHRAALDWLNENCKGAAVFFGVQVEVWKIGNSDPAPRFNVVSQPNDWANLVKQSSGTSELTNAEKIRLKYWTALVDFLLKSGSTFRCKNPAPHSWLRVANTLPGYRTGFEMSVRDHSVEVYIGIKQDEVRSPRLSTIYHKHQSEIEKEMGLKSEITENSDTCWLTFSLECDLANEPDWSRQHAWLKSAMEKMFVVVPKYLPKKED